MFVRTTWLHDARAGTVSLKLLNRYAIHCRPHARGVLALWHYSDFCRGCTAGTVDSVILPAIVYFLVVVLRPARLVLAPPLSLHREGHLPSVAVLCCCRFPVQRRPVRGVHGGV